MKKENEIKELKGKVEEDATDNFENFAQAVKELAMETRAGVCLIWECGGELEFLEERINWQEPDLKCKNCGAIWELKTRPK